MNEPRSAASLCDRCRERVATHLGVPTACMHVTPASRRSPSSRATEADELTLGARARVAIEPEHWLRLCDACLEQATAAGDVAVVFDLATWQDPRLPPPAS